MIDILFCSHNRREMTEATLGHLLKNTNWKLVRKVFLYDDASVDGTTQIVDAFARRICNLFGIKTEVCSENFGGPVAMMKHYLARPTWHAEPNGREEIFAKLDNDTAVPAGWLDVCLKVMEDHLELGLLGIECLDDTALPVSLQELDFVRGDHPFKGKRSWRPSSHIGGIGLMRSSAFQSKLGDLNQSETFFGFTHWQNTHPEVKRGWLSPALPVALLDHLPFEPWTTHTAESIRRGWARAWPAYPSSRAFLWDWMK